MTNLRSNSKKRQLLLAKITAGILILLAFYVMFSSTKLGAIVEALTPPTLPPKMTIDTVPWQNNQNWSLAQSDAFHFTSQGSRTLNIPMKWFVALEAPGDGIRQMLFSEREKFNSAEYIARFGFIPSVVSQNNPHGLPIGFTGAPYQSLVGLESEAEAIGFTCAACHTGQLVYAGQRHIIEGGQAMTDLGQLTLAIGAALGQTFISSKLPIFNGRFDRFAHNVLGDRYSDQNVVTLMNELDSVLGKLKAIPSGVDVVEGFSRLDALNRIGNQVFSIDTGRGDNYVNINAPVSYPPVWTAPWFSWVQYDGSIMQPLIRNAGEAMGTTAHTNFTAPAGEGRFSNMIPIDNLHWMEAQLASRDAPLTVKAFNGLRAPAWFSSLPAIDEDMARQGASLYKARCAACHLPALTPAVASGADPDNEFWNHFVPISWSVGDEVKSTVESYLDVKIIDQAYLGTDPGQGNVLGQRTVNTAGIGDSTIVGNTKGLGINIDVCTRESDYPGKKGANRLRTVTVTDEPLLAFPIALGAVVALSIEQWLDDQHLDEVGKQAYRGDRPNCLQAGQGYKARPLNGIWSTAPFLHNGSVPTLRHLLGPVAERPSVFLLGDPTFDPVDVGLKVVAVGATQGSYTDEGYFILKTALPGNSHLGHEFSDVKGPGVIGRALSADDRDAIIEFLKTI
ncbi:MAG: hypothetical protein ACJARY_002759 [Candidatus Azotimanducaceae bacterium]|jgi:hypothetical protein